MCVHTFGIQWTANDLVDIGRLCMWPCICESLRQTLSLEWVLWCCVSLYGILCIVVILRGEPAGREQLTSCSIGDSTFIILSFYAVGVAVIVYVDEEKKLRKTPTTGRLSDYLLLREVVLMH
ncbi:hypothetical protein Trydic_g15808 [Trypoxylus dichotomus]